HVRLAHFGAQGVAHGKPIADLGFLYRAVKRAKPLHLAVLRGDHRLRIFPCASAVRRSGHARAGPVPPASPDAKKPTQERYAPPPWAARTRWGPRPPPDGGESLALSANRPSAVGVALCLPAPSPSAPRGWPPARVGARPAWGTAVSACRTRVASLVWAAWSR